MNVRYSLTQTLAPLTEPILLPEAKLFLRVDHTAEDDLITSIVKGVRASTELYLNRQMVSARWALILDEFPPEILLPRPPCRSIIDVQYVDTAGNTQTLAASVYDLDIYRDPARLVPAYGQSWPSTRDQMAAVTVAFNAGYGVHGSVPTAIINAMLMMTAACYDHRDPLAEKRASTQLQRDPVIQALLSPYRVLEVH